MINKTTSILTRFKSFFLFSVICILFLALTGCSDTRYLSEKIFWHAQRKVANILKEKSGELESDDYDRIISEYKKVSDTCPLEPLAAKVQFIVTRIYLSQGNYSKARKELKNIINNFSHQGKIAGQAQFALGNILEVQGKWQEALEEYEKIIDLYPLTPLGLKMPIHILKYYQKIGDGFEADKAYRKATRQYVSLLEEYEQTPVAPMVSDHLATMHLQKGEVDNALEVWSGIVGDYPDSPQAVKSFLVKASLFAKEMDDLPKAIEAYQDFLDRYPKHKITPQVKFQLGLFYFKNGSLGEAKEIFKNILKDYPDNNDMRINAYLGLSYCYSKEADTQRIIEVYERLRKEYPASRAALTVPFLTARYYQDIKYNSKADGAYKEAISKYKNLLENAEKENINTRRIAHLLVLCYIKKNEIDKAEALLRSLADKHEKNPTYLLDLATLYLNLNALKEASGVYGELAEKFADNKFIAKLAASQLKAIEEKASQ